MKRTIELTPKSTKWIFIFNGTVNTAIGTNLLIHTDSWTHWSSILAFILIIAGPILTIYGIILFNPKIKVVPKVQVDDKGILIKEDIYKRQIDIDWLNVKEITYKSFELNFLLKNNKIETINLPTTAEKSIEIKKTIRKIADKRQIVIIGG